MIFGGFPLLARMQDARAAFLRAIDCFQAAGDLDNMVLLRCNLVHMLKVRAATSGEGGAGGRSVADARTVMSAHLFANQEAAYEAALELCQQVRWFVGSLIRSLIRSLFRLWD